MTSSIGSGSAEDSSVTSDTPSIADLPVLVSTDHSTRLKEPEWPRMPSRIVDDDEVSDVSMSAETDDSDDDDAGITSHIISQPSITPQSPATSNTGGPSRKRKQPVEEESKTSSAPRTDKFDYHKRVKHDEGLESYWTADGRLCVDKSLLPAEIWHHIFTFCPPSALGRLLRVNKIFKAHLDPSSTASTPLLACLSRSVAPIRQPDAIWQASRKLFRPGMPSPLQGYSEVAMWKLGCNFKCNFCERKDKLFPVPTTDPWKSGPGENRVRPMWQFGARSCGSCLKEKCIKVGLYFRSLFTCPSH
jgi:hypothetical protein